ncbi:MAG: TldD/PmbA family protein [Bacillota bacterium]|nr:TldD/PmbA family protein [Bacillota bacterium]
MIGRDEAFRLLSAALEASRAEQTEAVLDAEDVSYTRWNENFIHQNLNRRTRTLTVRVIDGCRTGLAATNVLDEAGVRECVDRALAYARLQPPRPQLADLPQPGAGGSGGDEGSGGAGSGRPVEASAAYVPATADFSPTDRADGCGEIIAAAQRRGLPSSGTFSTAQLEKAVANSHGVKAHHPSTKSFLRTIVTAPGDITGYSDRLTRDVRELDYQAVAEEAISKATLFSESRDLPAGRYDTVFEPVAFSDLIRFLGMLAFGAKAVQEGRSFMGPERGKKAMDEKVTIWDDGLDHRGLVTPFDAEGVPKRKVVFIDRGVVGDVVYDNETAARDGVASTGHASPHGRWARGPMPQNMFMAPGNTPADEILRTTRRGVLVTRFHYTHAPEPMRVVATGTTRDGTFLIEDGRIVARLRNLRFTESMITALANCDAVSREVRLTRDWWSTFESVLPTVRLRDFTFTGATTF